MYSYGLSVISIILVFLITYLQLKINKSELRQWCILVLACSLITNLSIMFQIVNISNENLGVWYEALSLIGTTMLPICWLFAVRYFVSASFKFNKKYICFFIVPIISILATFTNDFHHLMFKNFSIIFSERKFGILYYIMLINMCYTYLLTLVTFFRYMSKNIAKYKYQVILSCAFIILPAFGLLFGNLGMLSIKSYSNGIFQSLIAIITIEVLLQYQILTVLPISISNVLNTITDGFVVINKKGKVIAYNKVFLNLFDLGILDIKNLNIKDLISFKEFDTLTEDDINKILALDNYKNNVVFERLSNSLKLNLKYEGSLLDKKRR